ncbi:intermembrane transport protein PqiB [Aestuariibacter halophilus]|uniref:Intermembrane transport protein PqiB n=1 Tax=Fluctibacter halophilus TaxID=226011 RepID=A0ABS8G6A7_9ALTE|nr:intermembrane transport protein PqiB [Aestuariibacter halophilus]MCC2616085.1 intermembrane transport protein PqiB [Aestuariibacter halophilus]
MTDQQTSPSPAIVQNSQSVSWAWLVPMVALLIGAWMVYYQWSKTGPTITIEFPRATGIEVEKTKIKTRDVDIGVVKKIELKPDLTGVIVSAQIAANAEHLLREDSNFWLVTPRVSLSGISGLSTLLSGPYIAMEPSESGVESFSFKALEDPPVTPNGTPGLHVTLNSDDEFAFKEGDPVIYKGLKVGEFEDIYFNLEERVVYYNVFIEAPYHRLVTDTTKFWNISGVQFELEATGLRVQTGSLETLLTNGVTFGVPEGLPQGKQITQRAYFDIFPSYDDAVNHRFKAAAQYVLLIDDTVRGLKVGAPVEYRGLVIGEVRDINPVGSQDGNIMHDGYAIPVVIAIQPSRVDRPDNDDGVNQVRDQISTWVSQGLRASLKMGNLLTSALYVDLQHYDDVEPAELGQYKGFETIPVRPNDLAQITEKVSVLLDKMNALPLQQLTGSIDQTLGSVQLALEQLSSTAAQLEGVLAEVESEQLAGQLRQTLDGVQQLTNDLANGSDNQESLMRTLAEIRQTFKSLQPLLHKLNQAPNRLIFDGGDSTIREPRGKSPSKEDNP